MAFSFPSPFYAASCGELDPLLIKNGKLLVYVASEAFAEFYGVNPSTAITYLGQTGYREMNLQYAQQFIQQVDQFLQHSNNS